jgi:hypothetical protein
MREQHPPAVFTPSDEPYLGNQSLMRFDLIIVEAMRANQAVAKASHYGPLTDLQLAACEIIPQAVSISLSIRELIRQGYLLSGMILIRPLIERTALISYLVQNPAAVDLWKGGWPHGKRPSLAKMLDSMGWDRVGISMGRKICDTFNHLVHGDPLASEWNTIDLDSGSVGHASGRIINRPDVCDTLAGVAYSHMLILMAMMAATLPGVDETVSAISAAVNVATGG